MAYQTITFVFAIVLILFLSCRAPNDHLDTSKTYNENHKPSKLGVCWVGGDSISYHNFDSLLEHGGNWISQTPFAWQPDIYGPEIQLNNDRAWWGEADRGIKHTTAIAKSKNIKTMLKPHIWLRMSDGKWRSDLAMKNEQDWDSWFQNYEVMILHYANLAESLDIEALCIGTELYQTTKQHPDKWTDLISKVRNVYSGELTYAANWYKEFEEIEFWDQLDYIGIQAYFPLSKTDNPSKDEIVKNWKKHKSSIFEIAQKFNKKVVFTEVGYKNTADSAKEPWSWPQNLAKDAVTKSDETQIALYQAMFECLYHEEWMDGFFIWKWFHTTYRYQNFEEYFIAREARYDSLRRVRKWGDRPKVYFTPQHTKAKDVLKEWYTKSKV